jgi:predicted metal-dependent peptidase
MSKEELTPFDRVRKSIFVLIKRFPFIGRLSLHLQIVEREDIDTAATDGKHYFFNANFINSLCDEEIQFITAHEVLHIVFKHLKRSKRLNRVIYNYAADYVINLAIHEMDPEEKCFKLPQGVLYNQGYKGLYTEEVYKLLEDEANELTSMGALLDNHDVWHDLTDNMTVEEKRAFQNKWDQVIRSELNRARHQWKEVGVLHRLLEDSSPAKKNWKELLNEFLEYERNDFGYNPPPKDRWHLAEYGIETIPPDWSDQVEMIRNIVFAVDTSGSMLKEDIRMVHHEIVACLQQFQGRVEGKLIYCDDEVLEKGVYDLSQLDVAVPIGRRGTNFIPVFKWIESNMFGECAGLVYLTDGYGCFPEVAPHYPVLWMIVTKQRGRTVKVPFGQVAELTN